MYIPFRKIYRAFGELKHLSDEECERHLRRARLRTTKLAHLPWIAGVLAALVWLGAGAWLYRARGSFGTISLPEKVLTDSGWVIGLLAGAALAALMAALLARDAVLLHLMRREVHKARCPKCGQSLLGLPITFRGLGPPEPGDGKVRCPECGRQWVLFDIGLRPTDLVPWEMRGVPRDYGQVKRQGTWVSGSR